MPEHGLGRSLVEAYVYIDLVAYDGAPGASGGATVAQDDEGLRVRLGDVEVLVPYEDESAARETGVTFGTGLSELLDPGQWVLIATTYASRALEEGLFYAVGPADPARFDSVATGWRFAADAVAEALKFFPPGAAELPPDVFWSGLGRAVREDEPERLTRAKLENDLAFYRQSLDDFQRLHARP
ncbi:hypothetical protein ACIBIZ_49190 [Nonomuraea spiralis]|uniref:hypothetical protein n=1 Tax=Nonomuraea spiralis TaxID=46182 RepID=UPI0037BC72F3